LIVHDAENQIIAHQVTGLHDGLGGKSQWGLAGDGISQEVTGGEAWEASALREERPLGALAGTRWAKQEDVQ
jgi:hypothetical protein